MGFHTVSSAPPSGGASRTPTETVALAPSLKYTLTRICSMEYTKRVESVFEIIAEPNRRAILSLLVSSQQSVGEIERQLPCKCWGRPVFWNPQLTHSAVSTG